uniref:Integrase catalytic domain-containing protein n=1 Tax=Mycena chlorophos TaxID=658473 RepID=A0ABQ0L289_MYCCL|nr:predicted protein [Mycena chlorophos]
MGGAIKAAAILGIPPNQQPRTNNILESYNGRLKRGLMAHHSRGGRLPRTDRWIFILITEMLPQFFADWCDRRARETYYEGMMKAPAESTTHFRGSIAPVQRSTSSVPKPSLPRTLGEVMPALAAYVPCVPVELTEAETDALVMEELEKEELEKDGPTEGEMDAEDDGDIPVEEITIDVPMQTDSEVPKSPPESPEVSSSDSFSFSEHENALDQSAIALDLNLSVSPPLNSAIAPGILSEPDSDDDDGLPLDLHGFQAFRQSQLSRSPETPRRAQVAATRRATAFLELRDLEDKLAAHIQHMRLLGVEEEALSDHISPSLSLQLADMSTISDDTSASHSPKTSDSPLIRMPDSEEAGKLVGFERQIKQRRQESYKIL